MAAASAGPYASHLHFNSDRQSRQHLITQFFNGPDALPAAQPTASYSAEGKRYFTVHGIVLKSFHNPRGSVDPPVLLNDAPDGRRDLD